MAKTDIGPPDYRLMLPEIIKRNYPLVNIFGSKFFFLSIT